MTRRDGRRALTSGEGYARPQIERAIHLVTPQVAKSRVLVLQLSAHAPAFAADLAAFNGRSGLRPTLWDAVFVEDVTVQGGKGLPSVTKSGEEVAYWKGYYFNRGHYRTR